MNIPIFDGHCDTLYRLTLMPQQTLQNNNGHWDLNKMSDFAPQAQFFALFCDSKMPLHKLVIDREKKTFKRNCRIYKDNIEHCTSIAQAKNAWQNGKIAAFLSVEGAELIGCSLSGLQKAYNNGVRAVNITWNNANKLSGSHCDNPERGLSDEGKEYVNAMQKLGMLVDVSHISDKGFWDIMEITNKPVIATHSNSRSVCNHSRNLTDEQFKAIVKYHGCVGLNAYSKFISEDNATIENLFEHLEHFLALNGKHSVGLGGDWDGCSSFPKNWTGIWNWSDFYELLLKHNYSETLVKDIFFNNMMNTIARVCG